MQSTLNNRTIFCRDNIDVLGGIDSETIDLIYLDPPFNKKKVFTAPIGSSAEGAEFSDIFREEDVKEEWLLTIKEDSEKLHNFLTGIKQIDGRASYNFCYLAYMAIRLIECHRVLKDTGSLYLHCDPTMSHYLKVVLDCIFGEVNFRNEIVWCYNTQGKPKKGFARKHDVVYLFSKSDNFLFNKITIAPNDVKRYNKTDEDGRKYQIDGKGYTYYLDDGRHCPDYWTIPALTNNAKERTGYPTQKPTALLERIIRASSNEGDIVLDPFCGCATTCIAAEKMGRQWVGIDVSVKAYDLVRERLQKEIATPNNLPLFSKEIYFNTQAPKRTDTGEGYQLQKWVYVISNTAYEGEYKVGIASDWQKRLSSYQTSDPNRGYHIEHKVLTPHFRALEQHIHKIFDNRHEWVRGELKAIIDEMERYLVSKKGKS